MKSDQKIKEPILVVNPYTGRHVNISPLFDTMHDLEGKRADSPENLKDAIARAIRHVNLTGVSDSSATAGLRDITFDLYLLEDMFTAMSEFTA